VLVSYFPELRGTLIGPDDDAPLYAGAAPYMPQDASVDDISESRPSAPPPRVPPPPHIAIAPRLTPESPP
jgi:hypothetical protein